MTRSDTSKRRRFLRIVGGLTYILLGILIFGFWLGPALLGHRGAFAADMAQAALPALLAVWLVLFPVFLLLGFLIDTVLRLLGIVEDEIKLR